MDKTLNMMGLQKEFHIYQKETDEKLRLILDAVSGKVEKPIVLPTPEDVEAQPREFVAELDPKFKVLFEKHFDPADGFKAQENHPDRNRVTIFVPETFSNASDAHWKFFKNDIRSCSPIKETGDQYYEEVEKFLQRVVKNLRYDRNVQRK